MKKITGLTWTPSWMSLAGCIHGCLKFLNIAPSMGWLYGGTGIGFIINMHKDGSCPSGPTAWKTTRFYQLGRNVGYRIEGIYGDKRKPRYKDLQKQAWELTKSSLDQDIPVIGWEMAVPEWYVIEGYDDSGYYYNGPGADQGPSPKPWIKLGKTDIGLLEVYSILPHEPARDEILLKEALTFAIAFNQGSNKWVLPDYLAGNSAYQAWIEAVSSGKAASMGHAYNAAVWEECRRQAADFLREAKNRVPGAGGTSFESAIQSYTEVADQLKEVSQLYPFFENTREEPLGKNPKSEKAAEHLQAAQKAEAEGMANLEEILQGLG